MREVSVRAVDAFFAAASKKGLQPEVLVDGTGYPLAHWKDTKERVEWSAFALFMANVGKIWNEPELIEMGGSFFRSRLVRSVLLPARLLFAPRDIYRWVYTDPKGLGQQMFPCVKNLYRELGPTRAQLELWLPEGYANCPEFYSVSQGTITDLSRILGLGPAKVSRSSTPTSVVYDIEVRLEGQWAARTLHSVRARFSAMRVAKELKASNEELAEKYRLLEDYRLNLEKKVEERTDELNRTVGQLKEAQAARDKLFANINHEIRTPLSLISLAVADVRRRRTDLDEKSVQQFDGVEASTRQLLRLIDGLLVLAAGQEDRLRLRIAVFDLAARAKSSVAIWSNVAATRGLSVSYDGPETLAVHADEGAIDRIVANLLANALKFTPSGGSVAVELTELDGNIQLAVRDTGVGIDEEFRKRVFGRFEQGHAAVHAGSHGSGVGLSIVRELARAHGGDARVESPPSGGSRFVITFPAKPAPSSLAPVSSSPEPAGSVPPQAPGDFGIVEANEQKTEVFEPTSGVALATILIAEDNPLLRAQVADLLRADYRVLAAPDGISALDLARKHLPDMLVSDIGMPGMDGIELTKRFKELNGNRLSPVLLLTAMGAVRKRLEGLDAGAVDYITKPFEPEELRARIRNQLLLRSLALRLHETEKTVSLGVLSTGLAHELRNPANGIANAVGPLRRLLGDAIKIELPAGQLFKVVEQCTEQLATLSRQLLSLRGGELEMVDAKVSNLVERAENLASAALKHCNFQKKIDYSGPLSCSPSTILQVLGNLLENAAHAAGPNGWVRLSCMRDGDRVVFEIADSGKGVPQEIRQKIFEPFFTTKPPGVGTGLGLATAREVVLRHSGTIDVRDGNPGAVFRIELPLHRAESSRKVGA